MIPPRVRGLASNIAWVFLGDSTSTTGAGKTSLTHSSAGLNISIRRELASTMTASTGANIGAITALGTWADPGAGKINIGEVDATNAPGLYELHFPDLGFGTGDLSRALIGMVTATGVVPAPFECPLWAMNPQDGVHGGMTALPNAAANAAGGLLVSTAGSLDMDEMNADVEAIQTSTAGLTFTVSNVLDVNTLRIGGTVQTAGDVVSIATENGADLDELIATIGAAGAGLTAVALANGSIVTATFGTCDFTSTMKTSLQTAADAAITANATIIEINADVDELITTIGIAGAGLTAVALLNGSIVTATFGACDFTSTMKTSLQTAADAAITANTLVVEIGADADEIVAKLPAGNIADESLVIAATNSILAVLPAALSTNGNMKADVEEIAGNIGGASRLDRSARAIVTGTVGSASTTTSIVTSALAPAAGITDQFKGRIVIFDKDTTTANLRGQGTDITGSTAGGVLTVSTLTTAPVSGDTFTIT